MSKQSPAVDTAAPQDPAGTVAGPGEEFDFLLAQVDIDDPASVLQYPLLQWVPGSPGKKKEGGLPYEGGFFLSSDVNLAVPGAVPHVFVTKEGEEIEGFAVKDLEFAVIRTRRSFRVQPDVGLAQRFGQGEYDEACEAGKPRGQTHVLCVVKGMSEPVVLTFTGMAAKAMSGMGGNDRGILPQFGDRVLSAANRLAKEKGKGARYPRCAFRLIVGPEREENGTPVFTEVGSKEKAKVTLPSWIHEPGTLDPGTLNRLFVGNADFAAYQREFAMSEDWAEEWSDEKLAARRAKLGKKSSSVPAETTPGTAGNAGTSGRPAEQEVPF